MSTATLTSQEAWAAVDRAGALTGEALGCRIQAAQRHRAAVAGGVPDDRVAQLAALLARAEQAYREADQAYREARAVAMQLDQPTPQVSTPRAKRPTPAVCRPPVQALDSLQTALAVGEVVGRDYHRQAVQTAVEQAERRAARSIYELRALLDVSRADRVAAVFRAIGRVAQNRSGKHDDACWQRHAGCLAAHLRELLEGGAK